MKNIVSTLFGACLMFSLLSCGGNTETIYGSNSSASSASQSLPTKGKRIYGHTLSQVLPGTTVYGHYLPEFGGASWVERYDKNGRYIMQFSQPLLDRFNRSFQYAEASWRIDGNLLCYYQYSVGFDDGCVEVYQQQDVLQFADPASGQVVAVSTKIEWGNDTPYASAPEGASQSEPSEPSSGTGFIVSLTGEVVTNHHVVDGCKEVQIGHGGRISKVRIVSSDTESDLALLRLPYGVDSTVSFRQGDSVRSGDSVISVGFPLRGLLANEANVTVGTVSAMAGIGNDLRMMQITAPVQPGNSGGPLIDQSGNVVGVIVAKLDAILLAKITGDIPQNINFAIKSSVVEAFLQSNQVRYRRERSKTMLTAAQSADKVRLNVVVVECD